MILVIGGHYASALHAMAYMWQVGKDRRTIKPGHVVIDGKEYVAISGQSGPDVLRRYNQADVSGVELVDVAHISREILELVNEKGWAELRLLPVQKQRANTPRKKS